MQTEVKDYLLSQGMSIQKSSKYDVSFYCDDIPVLFKAVPGQWDSILFETVNSGKPGWLERGNVSVFCYYMVDGGTIYMISVKEVIRWIDSNKPKAHTRGSIGGTYYKIPIIALKSCGALLATFNV